MQIYNTAWLLVVKCGDLVLLFMFFIDILLYIQSLRPATATALFRGYVVGCAVSVECQPLWSRVSDGERVAYIGFRSLVLHNVLAAQGVDFLLLGVPRGWILMSGEGLERPGSCLELLGCASCPWGRERGENVTFSPRSRVPGAIQNRSFLEVFGDFFRG